MANNIGLRPSNTTVFKAYMATEMKIPIQRMDTIDYTVGGTTDKASGPVLHEWSYVLRVPVDTPPYTDYGTYMDIKTLFELNEAHGTPNDIITLRDHWGATHTVYFTGTFDPSSLTTMLTGGNAWFLIPVSMVEKL